MKQRPWTEDDKDAYTHHRLRAMTIPAKRQDGPVEDEWEYEDD